MIEATLRYNSNSDKPTIETSGDYLDSLVIPGRMLAHSDRALPQNLRNYADEYNLDYYVDPTLPDFRVGDNFRDENGVRNWHQKYAQEIGTQLEELLERRENVDASELSETEIRILTASDIDFQENYVPNCLEDETGKYEEIENIEDYRPKAVIPWYHRIASEKDVEVNDLILDEATDEATLPLKPCLFVTKAFLRRSGHRAVLVDLLSKYDIQQCFIWVENLDKQATDESDYVEITKLVNSLVEKGIAPHFFYGDYFATLLGHLGIEGTTYGTMYGEEAAEKRESRSGDGILTRYYLDPIKDFVKIPAAVDLQQRLGVDTCDCEVCNRQFESWQDLAQRQNNDDENMQTPVMKHHIQVRKEQIREVETQSMEETLEELESDYQEYIGHFNDSNQVSSSKTLDYLPRWYHALEKVSEDI